VTDRRPEDVDALLTRLLHTEDEALRAAREAGLAAGMPGIEVSAQYGRLLLLLVTAMCANRVLEIGTLAGYSTINLARGVGHAGHVVTLEYEPRHAEVARANLERAGVADRVEIIVGAALDTLPRLAERGDNFDLFFIDADKENNKSYVEWAIELGGSGSLILVDNVIRSGRIYEPAAEDLQARGVREMLEMMGEHPRLDVAAIQTVGAKGWEGFVFATVK
jgi:predicted O-methyltransferase YrrM